ncbi:MAG: IPT/TIG domain-containing protein [Deltaproteobacteria bacterium]|nr:IPT/TIG domain-containing protein [Deltaproteobacteria bacterium]
MLSPCSIINEDKKFRAFFAVVSVLCAVGCTDATSPIIFDTTEASETDNPLGPYTITTSVRDNNAVNGVYMRYRVALGQDATVALAPVGNGDYSTEIGGLQRGNRVDYYVFAKDADGNEVRHPDGAPTTRFCFDVGTYPSKPRLLDLYPVKGPSSGRTRVRLVGSDFRAGSRIYFGANEANELAIGADGQITVYTPPGTEGVVDVTIVNPSRAGMGNLACPRANPDTREGRHTLVGAFTYTPAPVITAVLPVSGPTAGGTVITVTGRNFYPGATLQVGDKFATSVTIASDGKTISGTVPPATAGFVDVCVRNLDSGEGCSRGAYEYVPPPDLVSIAPDRGPDSGGTAITLTGTGFRPGVKVYFGPLLAPTTVWVTSTQITTMTPAHIEGYENVRVENADGQSDTLVNGFYFVGPPSITSVTPSRGPTSGGQMVTIVGKNFLAGASVTFGGTPAVVMSVSPDLTTIVVTTPARGSAGFVNVTVTNPAPDGRSGTKTNAYEYYLAPVVTTVTPNSGPTAGGTRVTLAGQRFTGVSEVRFDGVLGTSLAFVSDTQVDVTTPAHVKGAVDVALTIGTGGTGTCVGCFTYIPPPTFSSITPNRGPIEGNCLEVTITGSEFQAGATVTIGGVACASVNVVNSTTITCRPGALPAGLLAIIIMNPDGQSVTAANAYTSVPLTFSPPGGLLTGYTRLTVTGEAFVSGSTINFDSVPQTTVFVSSTTLRIANTPAHAAGEVTVTVVNPGSCANMAAAKFKYRHFKEKTTFASGYTTQHVRFADLTRTGKNDLIAGNGPLSGNGSQPAQVYANDGTGTFTLRQSLDTGAWYHVDVGDVDGVNGPDVLLGGEPGSRLWINVGNGMLSKSSVGFNTVSNGDFDAQFVDTDGDGDLDIVLMHITNTGAPALLDAIYVNQGGGTFTKVDLPANGNIHDHKMAWADFRRIGRNDIAGNVDTVNYTPKSLNFFWLNNGNNSFSLDRTNPDFAAMEGDMFGLAAADLNGDGWPDLLVPNLTCGRTARTYLRNVQNSTVPSFTAVAGAFGANTDAQGRQDATTSVEIVDVDGDGDMDVLWVVIGYCPTQSGSWTLSPRAQRLFVNDGTGTFVEAADSMPKTGGGADVTFDALGAGFGDVDGDGSPDMAIGSYTQGNRLYTQTTAP